jgi:hypothetical protein
VDIGLRRQVAEESIGGVEILLARHHPGVVTDSISE